MELENRRIRPDDRDAALLECRAQRLAHRVEAWPCDVPEIAAPGFENDLARRRSGIAGGNRRKLAESEGDRRARNLGLGGERWSYYETMAGGCGASASSPGRHAAHSHMTNTLNTPAEVLEYHYPVRIRRYQRRRGSGGSGSRPGGDGLVREFEFLDSARVTLITERRVHAPWGLAGGGDGKPGRNRLDGEELPSKASVDVGPGQVLTVETPGGGGHGRVS